MDYRLEVTGDDQVVLSLNKIAGNIKDLGGPMREVGDYLTSFFAGEVFASRGGVIGHPWQALDDRYAVYKAKRYPGSPPLIRTGLMNRSFKSFPQPLSVAIRNEAPYFAYHQEGGGHLPKRIMMSIDDTRANKIVGMIEREIAGIIGNA